MNNIFINRIELQKTNVKINEILQSNLTTEGKLLNNLQELQENIRVNYKKLDNKEDEINYNFTMFQKNCHRCVKELQNTIGLYEAAQANAIHYIKQKTEELR